MEGRSQPALPEELNGAYCILGPVITVSTDQLCIVRRINSALPCDHYVWILIIIKVAKRWGTEIRNESNNQTKERKTEGTVGTSLKQ